MHCTNRADRHPRPVSFRAVRPFAVLLHFRSVPRRLLDSRLALSRAAGPSSATIIADPDANNTSAIAVDVLFISDTLAAQQISVLTATDYFARRTQLQRDFPGGLLIRSRELAPGQIARDVPLNPNCNRVRTLLFARYLTPGDHRQSVANVSRILVSLGREDFTVSR